MQGHGPGHGPGPGHRRCVICGLEPHGEVDAKGNERYTYPQTAQEARIWQQSMGAKDVCVESIQHNCCVCVEHIPEFVRRSKRLAKKQRTHERHEDLRRRRLGEAGIDGCECPDLEPPRCSVNVLLINGASLPSYCGKGQSCVEIKAEAREEQEGGASGTPKRQSATKRYNPDDSDTEIFVQESEFQDIGATFPDIDETEVTVLRTPVQEDEKIEKIKKPCPTGGEGKEGEEECTNRSPVCMPGCTDVLVLGRGVHPTDVCPCKCDQCTKQPTAGLKEEDACCMPPCCPDTQEHFDQPPCGCECEQQVRRVMGKVIKTQKQRINELETMLCKQNNLHSALQRKVDELYCEFGRLDDDDKVRLACCASGRGPPDCAQLRDQSTSTPRYHHHHQQQQPDRRRRPERLNTKDTLPEELPPVEEARRSDNGSSSPDPRVHLYNEKNPSKTPEKKTRKPGWLCFGKSSETDKGTQKE